MLKYILIAIGFISSMINVLEDIRAYHRGEYDPIGFRLRQGYEWKPILIIANFGTWPPIFYFTYFNKSYVYAYIYVICLLFIPSLYRTILNFKCYSRIKRKRILIETAIMDVLFVLLVIYGYKMFF